MRKLQYLLTLLGLILSFNGISQFDPFEEQAKKGITTGYPVTTEINQGDANNKINRIEFDRCNGVLNIS